MRRSKESVDQYSGIKFFFERTLQCDWKLLGLVRPARPKKLPIVLSRDEAPIKRWVSLGLEAPCWRVRNRPA
jgi:hypothetical protein